MVNFYGAGKAFNLRYLRNGQLPRAASYKPAGGFNVRQPIDMCTHNTNYVEVKFEQPGSKSLISGLLKGLFGGSMGGGYGFGFGGGFGLPGLGGGFGLPGLGGGFGLPGLGGGFGLPGLGGILGLGNQNNKYTNSTMSDGDKQLQNLKTLYPQLNIVKNTDDTFTASNAKGETIATNVSFNELTEMLKAGTSVTTGDARVTTGDASVTTGDASITTGDASITTGDARDVTTNIETPETQAPGSNMERNVNNTPATPRANSTPSARGSSGKRGVHVPEGWYNATKSKDEYEKLKLLMYDKNTTAGTVTQAIVMSKTNYFSPFEIDTITKEMIKYNPSVFNSDGTIKGNANWEKLDIPSIDAITKSLSKSET